ncbi:MAG: chromosomal replication initiator DnaA [Rhizobiales bacterium]|nr:chromosomal replication initiator DnaA [Hyphomicrobiales bacterium]
MSQFCEPAPFRTVRSLPSLKDQFAGTIEPAVAAAFGVSVDELRARTRRTATVALARQCVMYLAHTTFGWSHTAVGAACGRNRRTVAHGCRLVEERRERPAFDALVARLEATLFAQLCGDGA